MDIKAKVEEIVAKLQANPALLKAFQANPVKALEHMTGLDLPDEQLQPVITAVKAKLAASGIGEKLGALGGLFQ